MHCFSSTLVDFQYICLWEEVAEVTSSALEQSSLCFDEARMLHRLLLRFNSSSCTTKEVDVLLTVDGCLLSEQRPVVHLWGITHQLICGMWQTLGEGKGGIEVKGQGGSMCVWRNMVYILLFGMQMSSDSVVTVAWGLPVCVCLGDRRGCPRTGVRGHVLPEDKQDQR